MSQPHILLRGDRLALGLPRQELLPEYHRWENDPGTILGYGTQMPTAWEVRAAGWEAQARSEMRRSFEVVRLEDEQAIGMTVLYVDQAVQRAEYIILLAPEARGNHYATEATTLTLDWAFNLAALRGVWLKVLEPNRAGIVAYEKAGFRQAGRLRKAGYWLGRSVDELLMDALPEDFAGPSRVAPSSTD
ncbi:GNAT family N-acetyltransferase [Streptomyces sp. TS71-3]|uniref:GNAT family N-acetyltransferase n=1 Tax=Streptomyces sp. TS71-3 TaxID=2733862 RepID=UPI001B29F8DE|nr:GNAT family protein [Streptomyces sp. TS71-3]GHJ39884.1 N-acetyltransferase [Streptomyces sp. TS71-3]